VVPACSGGSCPRNMPPYRTTPGADTGGRDCLIFNTGAGSRHNGAAREAYFAFASPAQQAAPALPLWAAVRVKKPPLPISWADT